MPSPSTPSNIEALRNRAVLYRNMGEPEQAVRDNDENIRLEPDDPSVHQQRQAALEQVVEEGC